MRTEMSRKSERRTQFSTYSNGGSRMRRVVALVVSSSAVALSGSCGWLDRRSDFETLIFSRSEQRDSAIAQLAPAKQVELYLYAMEVVQPPVLSVMESLLTSDSVLAPVVAARLAHEEDKATLLDLILLGGNMLCTLGWPDRRTDAATRLAGIVSERAGGLTDWRAGEAEALLAGGCRTSEIRERVESRRPVVVPPIR